MNQVKNNKITRELISTSLSENLGLSYKYCYDQIDIVLSLILENLKICNKVCIKNIGTFEVKYKNKRIGRNPKTLETYEISERNVVKFTLSNNLKSKNEY